eukprot:6874553-Alexandrium_andersonii.AAC.1
MGPRSSSSERLQQLCLCRNSSVGTPSRSLWWLINASSGPKIQPEGAAIPARPTGQAALVRGSRRKSGTPFRRSKHRRRRLLHLDLWNGGPRLSPRAAERAGTAAPSGW